jgi:hypothetical protein
MKDGDYLPAYADMFVMFASLCGLNFNIHNLLMGVFESSDPLYAITCLFPYVECIGMLYASKFSRLLDSHIAYFVLLAGCFLVYATAQMTLEGMAKIKYRWFYFEPVVFGGIVFADHSD